MLVIVFGVWCYDVVGVGRDVGFIEYGVWCVVVGFG